jgi:WD40 repeat protein
MSDLEALVVTLKNELNEERRKRLELEGELDILALDNERLRGELQKMRAIALSSPSSAVSPVAGEIVNSSDNANLTPVLGEVNDSDWQQLLTEGDKLYAKSLKTRIENACGGFNAIATCFCNVDASDPGSFSYIACGGVDKTLRIYENGEATKALISIPCTAPILAMDACGHYLACSLMDGSHVVVSIHVSCCVCILIILPYLYLFSLLEYLFMSFSCCSRHATPPCESILRPLSDLFPPCSCPHVSYWGFPSYYLFRRNYLLSYYQSNINFNINFNLNSNFNFNLKLNLSDPAMPAESISAANNHSKYNVDIKFSPDGQFLATVSHDKTVNLYKRR